MGEAQFGFCLNTSTIRCGELSLEEKLAVTAEAGYDGIEPWVSELDEFAAGGGDLADLRKRTRDSGLEIVNLIGFFNWATENDADRTEGIAEARRAFAMAQTVGCKFVAAPPWGLTDVTGMDLFGIAKRYGELIDIGAEYGVMPLLEYWGHSKTLGKLGEGLLVAGECGRSEALILADTFHTYKGSGTIAGLELLGPNVLGLLHINDYPGEPATDVIADAERVYPGDGIAPLAELLGSLARAGYEGMLSVELFNREYWAQDALTVAKKGLEKTRAIVAEA